jgi:phenylpropionate dioxygenase-like ring-hydroxylating dioxygenase large terminal subunit
MLNQILRDEFWHLLCHRTELPESGHYLKLQWLNEELVIFNDAGNIIAFDNLCPHRGTRFFSDNHGIGAISCPYHGWGYHGGKLHIPCRDQYNASELQQARLNILQIEWCGDFLFVSVTPKFPLYEQLGSSYDLVASASFNISGRSDFDSYVYACDWRVAVENGLESLHTPFIHPSSLGQLSLAEGENKYSEWTVAAYFLMNESSEKKKLRSIKKLFNIEDQFEGYMSIYMFPFSMLSSTFGYSYSLQNFFPTPERGKTFFSSRLLNGTTKNATAAQALRHFFDSSASLNRQIFKEDSDICARINLDFYEKGKSTILSVQEEKIHHFRKCLEKVLHPTPA